MILSNQNKLDKLKNYKLHKIYALIQLHLLHWRFFSSNKKFIPNRLPHARLVYDSTGLIGPI